jgi:uncharacterized membrane protein
MSGDNVSQSEPPLFSAILTPPRSLTRSGFAVLMSVFTLLSLGPAVLFLVLGAWPVLGFLGLDVLLVYLAFRVSFRSQNAYEQVTVTRSEFTLRRVSHRGYAQQWTFNPAWVRLIRESDADYGLRRLSVVSRGRVLPIATSLAPAERASFAKALASALRQAR